VTVAQRINVRNHVKFSRDGSWQRYRDFFHFQDGGRPPSWILKSSIF